MFKQAFFFNHFWKLDSFFVWLNHTIIIQLNTPAAELKIDAINAIVLKSTKHAISSDLIEVLTVTDCLLQDELLQRCSGLQSVGLWRGWHCGLDPGLHWYRYYVSMIILYHRCCQELVLCFSSMVSTVWQGLRTPVFPEVLQYTRISYYLQLLIKYSVVHLQHPISFFGKIALVFTSFASLLLFSL